MALIKCPECSREVSDKANCCPNCGYVINNGNDDKSSNSNKKWIVPVAVVMVIALVIGGFFIFRNNDKKALTAQPSTSQTAEQFQTPDMTLFEVSGDVKEIYAIENPVLPILSRAGKSILFTKEGVWDNYNDIGKDEDYAITIKRNADGQLTLLSGRNLDYEWSFEYQWVNGHPIAEILNGSEGGDATSLEYQDNKLINVTLTGNDIDDKYVWTYKIKDIKTDNHGNWVERVWEHSSEYYSFNYEINGYSAKPDNMTSEELVEKRKIIYWE